jgi:hypothetical protein
MHKRTWTIGKTRRLLYRVSSLLGLFNAILRGPAAILRFFSRREVHRGLARAMRRAKL